MIRLSAWEPAMRLSAQYDTAGIAVEAVADRWMESGKIGFFYGIGSQQVADQPFVQGKIFRFGFLGQNSGRFIQQQDIFILIKNADIL